MKKEKNPNIPLNIGTFSMAKEEKSVSRATNLGQLMRNVSKNITKKNKQNERQYFENCSKNYFQKLNRKKMKSQIKATNCDLNNYSVF